MEHYSNKNQAAEMTRWGVISSLRKLIWSKRSSQIDNPGRLA